MLLPILAPDWSTHYERSGFLETGRYAEAVDYVRRLDLASEYARVIDYGSSPEGRRMVALVVSKDRQFTPEALRASKKPLIFVQNGIHSGEIEGKDASLILAREMLITGKERHLLDGANWVIVPIFSVDAHERFSAYNRINQAGPREMGWRATAQNYNLNRDWIKADAPEMRNQVGLVNRFMPDFLFDNHTTNGADHQYVLTLSVPMGPELPKPIADWQREMYTQVKRRTETDGFLTAPYFSMADRLDPTKGISITSYGPRFSHGYWSALNRPSVLVETHVLKPYKQRVDATYSLMKRTVEKCIADAPQLKAMIAAADRSAEQGQPHAVLTSRTGPERTPFTFRGWQAAAYTSEVTGGRIAGWDRSKPIVVDTFIRETFHPDFVVSDPPEAYAVPPAWTEVIDRLRVHGIQMRRLREPLTDNFASASFSEVKFSVAPFEGRFQPSFQMRRISERRTLPVGTVIVPIRQARGKLAMHLLEPSAPDSLLNWGLFNTIFESKEYAEDYAMEPVAKKMLADSPTLRKEYEERLKDDSFANNPRARLQFFYERSPYFDQRLNKYPVVFLRRDQLMALP
jgi:hypothetical protein